MLHSKENNLELVTKFNKLHAEIENQRADLQSALYDAANSAREIYRRILKDETLDVDRFEKEYWLIKTVTLELATRAAGELHHMLNKR